MPEIFTHENLRQTPREMLVCYGVSGLSLTVSIGNIPDRQGQRATRCGTSQAMNCSQSIHTSKAKRNQGVGIVARRWLVWPFDGVAMGRQWVMCLSLSAWIVEAMRNGGCYHWQGLFGVESLHTPTNFLFPFSLFERVENKL